MFQLSGFYFANQYVEDLLKTESRGEKETIIGYKEIIIFTFWRVDICLCHT
jgi:hypothetical protein